MVFFHPWGFSGLISAVCPVWRSEDQAAESSDNLSGLVVQKYLDDEPLSFFKVAFSGHISGEAVFLTSVCWRGSFYCAILIRDGKKRASSVPVLHFGARFERGSVITLGCFYNLMES